MAGVQETQRRRIAGLFLTVGILLILGGLVSIAFHTSPVQSPMPHRPVAATPILLQRFLYVLILLVLFFSVSLLAFLRWSRHFRRFILRRPSPPTPAEDVWKMHRLPPEDDPEEPEDSAAGLEPDPD